MCCQRREQGQTFAEYALLLLLAAAIVVAVLSAMGASVESILSRVAGLLGN